MEDLEQNDGSAEKPYAMSKSLRKLLNKKNKWNIEYQKINLKKK